MRRAAIALVLSVLSAGVLTAMTPASLAAADKPLPSKDPFYSYDGAKPLRDIKPGTVLKQRTENV